SRLARPPVFRFVCRRLQALHLHARQAPGKQRKVAAAAQNKSALGTINANPVGTMSRSESRNEHDLSKFECGEQALDDWLRRRALQNEGSGASRTYVVCTDRHVVGYYAL